MGEGKVQNQASAIVYMVFDWQRHVDAGDHDAADKLWARIIAEQARMASLRDEADDDNE